MKITEYFQQIKKDNNVLKIIFIQVQRFVQWLEPLFEVSSLPLKQNLTTGEFGVILCYLFLLQITVGLGATAPKKMRLIPHSLMAVGDQTLCLPCITFLLDNREFGLLIRYLNIGYRRLTVLLG